MTKLPFWATKLSHRKLKNLSIATWAVVLLGHYCRYDIIGITRISPFFADEGFKIVIDTIATIGMLFILSITRKMPASTYRITDSALSLISKWERHYYGD